MRLLISRHLENFLALYDARNMHVAAERKGVSQPALTKSLKLLESELGMELFLRTSRGLEPTDAGNILYLHARAIDQEARFAGLDVQELHQNLGGHIRIGVGQVLAVSTFPQVLVAFHMQFPKVQATVETGISTQLVDALVNERLDVVVAALPEVPLPERFAATPLFKSDMVVICRQGHPLRSRKTTSLRELSRYGRVGFVEDREFEKKSRHMLGSRAERLQPVLQTSSLSIMFGILVATDYYAIVSEMILPRARRESLDQLPVEEGLWQLDIDIMCKSSLMASQPIRTIREALLTSARDHNA
ncbi:LysR family transcriptional regulator [Chelativorans sp. AA-79]|uniref:LysR family transcriptional regulator n=1 Tax=Chelativorans sp. AA-79 TaxID=3028735 RepID=UPI0023F99E3E|nr:LysR family transcriptional regulator [Chelativorans sp. AA-79]WEX12098.1 LysR family transcriptional regulator [Chelativorans sp. AA-79]